MRAGTAYQFREAAGPPVHLGLGRLRQADVLRVVWTNGVPQDRLQPQIDQRIVEEQVLKGSCPFLYAWNGERFALRHRPALELPARPAGGARRLGRRSDPHELVRVDGAELAAASTASRVTEELWEAAYFDAVRLWVVDHPAGVEVASSLRVVPGERQTGSAVLAARDIHPVAAAWDGKGGDVTARVRARDEVYADGYEPGPYQGVAKPWTFTFDLGEAPGTPVRLLLDGWIFPADASLNLAAAQRPDLPLSASALEVETADRVADADAFHGLPGGQDQDDGRGHPDVALRSPPPAHRHLPLARLGPHRLDPRDGRRRPGGPGPPQAQRTDLRYRGFSRLSVGPPTGRTATSTRTAAKNSPLAPLPGRYTRYGDVRELLERRGRPLGDPRPGDEIALEFDAAGLPPVAAGLAAHPVFREQRLGQGRRPQHLRGAADRAAAVPCDGEVWRSVPGYAGDAGVPGAVADAGDWADGAALKRRNISPPSESASDSSPRRMVSSHGSWIGSNAPRDFNVSRIDKDLRSIASPLSGSKAAIRTKRPRDRSGSRRGGVRRPPVSR